MMGDKSGLWDSRQSIMAMEEQKRHTQEIGVGDIDNFLCT